MALTRGKNLSYPAVYVNDFSIQVYCNYHPNAAFIRTVSDDSLIWKEDIPFMNALQTINKFNNESIHGSALRMLT